MWNKYACRRQNAKDHPTRKWMVVSVLGLTEQLLSQSLQDTYSTWYAQYYSKQHMEAALVKAPRTEYEAAIEWIEQLQRQVWSTKVGLFIVCREIEQRGTKATGKTELTKIREREEEEKEEKEEKESVAHQAIA